MKTICPHCNQEYPETPEEYLGMSLECPTCHRNFVCEKGVTPQEMAATHAQRQEKQLRNRRILILPFCIVFAVVVAVLSCLPKAYNYYVYRRDCKNLKELQAQKAQRYNEAYAKMKAVLLRARNHCLGSNANDKDREENLKEFVADYNSASPERLGLPVLGNETVNNISMILFFTKVDLYHWLLEDKSCWLRDPIEDIFGPLEKLR